jgi:hypothetical protein
MMHGQGTPATFKSFEILLISEGKKGKPNKSPYSSLANIFRLGIFQVFEIPGGNSTTGV